MTYMCAITEASKTYNKEQPEATPKAIIEATPREELKTLYFIYKSKNQNLLRILQS